MSQSAPNSRAPSPSPAPAPGRGGSRHGSGKKSIKRRNVEAAGIIGNATQEATRQRHLRLQQCIDSLANPSGRSLSSNELRIIIRLSMWLQLHHGYTEAAAIDAASVWSGSSHMTIAPAYHHYLETQELTEPDTSQQGRGNPQHPLHDTSLTLEQILRIHQLLIEAKLKSEFIPAREICHRLVLPVGMRQLQRILKQW